MSRSLITRPQPGPSNVCRGGTTGGITAAQQQQLSLGRQQLTPHTLQLLMVAKAKHGDLLGVLQVQMTTAMISGTCQS